MLRKCQVIPSGRCQDKEDSERMKENVMSQYRWVKDKLTTKKSQDVDNTIVVYVMELDYRSK